MNLDWAKQFGQRVREVFGDATPIFAEDEHGNVWINKEHEHDPETDVLVRAAPDFHNWRDK